MSERFVVRECHGYAIGAEGVLLPGASQMGMTVTVHDMAYCGRVVRAWRSERNVFDRDAQGRWFAHSRERRFANMRREARKLADRLNASE